VGTLQDVDSQGYAPSDEERTVDLLGQAVPGRLRGKEHVGDDDEILFPAQTRDDTDRGWGEHVGSNDERLLAERPPHWD
jgi:hypothetical protein